MTSSSSNAVDEGSVQFDEVRRERHQPLQARVPAARVVDGHLGAGVSQGSQEFGDGGVVVDRVMFC